MSIFAASDRGSGYSFSSSFATRSASFCVRQGFVRDAGGQLERLRGIGRGGCDREAHENG